MSPHEDDGVVSAPAARFSARESGFARSILRYAARHPGLLAAFLISGFVVGIAYRFLLKPTAERGVAN